MASCRPLPPLSVLLPALKFCPGLCLAAGRDLHSALELHAAGTQQRLFGWSRRGRRVAYDIAKALNYLHSKVGRGGGVAASAGAGQQTMVSLASLSL